MWPSSGCHVHVVKNVVHGLQRHAFKVIILEFVSNQVFVPFGTIVAKRR